MIKTLDLGVNRFAGGPCQDGEGAAGRSLPEQGEGFPAWLPRSPSHPPARRSCQFVTKPGFQLNPKRQGSGVKQTRW